MAGVAVLQDRVVGPRAGRTVALMGAGARPMVTVVKAPRVHRRNETRDLTKPILAALNSLPGVRVSRNNTGVLKDERGVPVRYGLGLGSADLVGIVSCRYCIAHITYYGDVVEVGRAFALEVKWPGEKPTADQVRWLASVRRLGGFACVVHSIEEATSAAARCRDGLSE